MSSSWLPAGFRAPERLTLDSDHHLRTARAADTPLSYPAVMSAQERLWEQYGGPWGWPAATLTPAEERAYLEDDERRAREREGFAYAVFTKGEREILGYVYVERPMPGQADDADALMSWWLVDEHTGGPLESCVAERVPRWLREEWLRGRPRWGIATDAGAK